MGVVSSSIMRKRQLEDSMHLLLSCRLTADLKRSSVSHSTLHLNHATLLTEQVLLTHTRQMLVITTLGSLTTRASRLQSAALIELDTKKSKLLAKTVGSTSKIFQSTCPAIAWSD